MDSIYACEFILKFKIQSLKDKKVSEEAAWILCFWLFKVAVNSALRNKMHSILKKNKRYPQGGRNFCAVISSEWGQSNQKAEMMRC